MGLCRSQSMAMHIYWEYNINQNTKTQQTKHSNWHSKNSKHWISVDWMWENATAICYLQKTPTDAYLPMYRANFPFKRYHICKSNKYRIDSWLPWNYPISCMCSVHMIVPMVMPKVLNELWQYLPFNIIIFRLHIELMIWF